MDNDTTLESIDEEKTVPVPAVPMAELVKQPRYPVRGWDGDHNNGVDDRAMRGWGRSW